MINPQVVYEDNYILALNKAAGWVVNDSETAHGNPVLQDWISENYNFEISQSKELRSGIVHRLDKPTSGVILVAKSKTVFYALQKQFAERLTEKVYIALVHGHVKNETGTINAPIGRLPWKRNKFGVITDGRQSLTEFKVKQYFDNDFTLLELHPKTGRTHQLRVHLKHIGHPIVSDPLYAGRKTVRSDIKNWPRLWLHAKSIEFTHPITNKKMHIEAPLPPDLKLP
jgi:23S rRNA pseudouridine1911/1915/1917 synthase